MLPCLGVLGLGWLGHPFSAPSPTTDLQGFALQPPLLAPFPPGPALSKAFGVMEPVKELLRLMAGIGAFSMQSGSGGALCPAVPGTVLLLSACGAPGAAGEEPSLRLAGGCRQVMPARGTGRSSFPYFLSWGFLGGFGWEWQERSHGDLAASSVAACLPL